MTDAGITQICYSYSNPIGDNVTENDCLFCKIVNKEIPTTMEYEDDDICAFNDINPQAPTHIQVIPKKHIAKVSETSDGDAALLGKILLVCRKLAKEKEIEKGYRLVVNNGAPAGQSVFHLHFHILGGRSFTWPPG